VTLTPTIGPNTRRAGAFALVGTFSVAVPVLGRSTIVFFAAVAVLSLFVIDDGAAFELFARAADREDRTLYSLAAFSLAIAGLAILTTLFGMPVSVFVASVLVLCYGNLTERLVEGQDRSEVVPAAVFVCGGLVAGTVGQLAVLAINGGTGITPTGATGGTGMTAATTVAFEALPLVVFLAATGALLAALLRTALFARDDPLVMFTVGLLLWLFAELSVSASVGDVAVALSLTAALGALSYGLGTASIAGMLTGMMLVLSTTVLGGYDWFAVLVTFFGVGSLAAKYRIDEKRERGIAEVNEGARGTGNVLANAAVALGAVLGFAASSLLPVAPATFLFAFGGSLAGAMADTLSSELGGLFDGPRLVTTFERVPPGTDGGVTWQGELAGVCGALAVAGVTGVLFEAIGPLGAGVIAVAGVGGMTVDSLLGATIEPRVGNQGVNFLATLAAALLAAGLALAIGLVGIGGLAG
jgi:uncharacterized protein (TIGR00297 family)